MTKVKPKIFTELMGEGDWHDHEDRVARELDGDVQPGSGSSVRAKGDVKLRESDFLIENKSTSAASIRVQGKWLAKITKEAIGIGRSPALAIEIQGHDDPMMSRDWIVIPLHVFKELVDGS